MAFEMMSADSIFLAIVPLRFGVDQQNIAMECDSMMFVNTRTTAAVLAVVLTTTALGQAPAPAPTTPTLWSFLGIPQGVQKVRGALTNRRGNTPRTEPKVPMKALNDPANLESENPAIKRAAEIKQAEDLKPQKIKAIKYLTSIGCGCYDKDGSVTDALVAAAEDCTEDVRLTTMKEIKAAANGKCCANCGQVCCCNDKVLAKLAKVAYERDEFGCYSEPSSRVRAAAAEALAACCPGSPPLEILSSEPDAEVVPETLKPVPEKGPGTSGPVREGEPGVLPESVGDEAEELKIVPADQSAIFNLSDEPHLQPVSAVGRSLQPRLRPQTGLPEGIARMRQLMTSQQSLTTATPNPGGGVVMAYDARLAIAYVHFEQQNQIVARGTLLHLRPDPRLDSGFHGTWEVIEALPGCATLRPVQAEGTSRVQVGDHANFGTPPVKVAQASFSDQ